MSKPIESKDPAQMEKDNQSRGADPHGRADPQPGDGENNPDDPGSVERGG